MCCFSGSVERVANTNIFARASREGRQFLVYSMQLATKSEVAMILPIPVPKGSSEDAVRFINLEKYEEFFSDMRSGFPTKVAAGRANSLGGSAPDKPLAVVEVGSFIASFVPSLKDFARLDEQFRLPAGVWDRLPQYKDWGFAVFQLKKGEQKVHPMAFEFPRSNPWQLFFPTVHIHDGTVKERASFDHMLFCQHPGRMVSGWEESPQTAGLFMRKHREAHGIIDPNAHVHRRIIRGMHKNADVIV